MRAKKKLRRPKTARVAVEDRDDEGVGENAFESGKKRYGSRKHG